MNEEELNLSGLCFDPVGYIFNEYTEQPIPIPTQIPSLDGILSGGLQPGVWCIMAEPGAGKSAFGLQLAYYTAFNNIAAMYVSLEMPAYQCWYRIASAFSYRLGSNYGIAPFKWSEVPNLGRQARKAIMQPDGKQDKTKLAGEYSDCFIQATWLLDQSARRLHIIDIPEARNIEYLKQLIQASKQVGAGLVVIDYMQQITTSEHEVSVYDRITRVSSELKDIANELKIPIVVIVSMNRDTLKSKEISMHSGSGSASIEYDACGVITLQQDKEASTPDVRRVKLKVQKNRFGIAGKTVLLDFYPAYNVFYQAQVQEE